MRTRKVGTPALVALTAAGVEHTVHSYDHDPRSGTGYGLEAVEALGLPADQVLKTLLAEVDGTVIVAVVPVTTSLDLKALAAAVGGKRATMADPTTAQRATGYVVGGISPLGQRTKHPTVVDRSVTDHDTVYVSGGRRGLDVGLSPQDLVRMTAATVAPIAR